MRMESMKYKLAILAVAICLAVVAAGIWYCLAGASREEEMRTGTLVWESAREEMVRL